MTRQEREELRLTQIDRELRRNGFRYHKTRTRQRKEHKRYTSSPCKHLVYVDGHLEVVEYIHRNKGELIRTAKYSAEWNIRAKKKESKYKD